MAPVRSPRVQTSVARASCEAAATVTKAILVMIVHTVAQVQKATHCHAQDMVYAVLLEEAPHASVNLDGSEPHVQNGHVYQQAQSF